MTVELDVFSGRPNPRWELTEQERQRVEKLLSGPPEEADPGTGAKAGLGYRGFVLTEGARRIRAGAGTALETYLAGLARERGYGGLLEDLRC